MPETDLSSFTLKFSYNDDLDKRRDIIFPAEQLKQAESKSLNEALYKMAAH